VRGVWCGTVRGIRRAPSYLVSTRYYTGYTIARTPIYTASHLTSKPSPVYTHIQQACAEPLRAPRPPFANAPGRRHNSLGTNGTPAPAPATQAYDDPFTTPSIVSLSPIDCTTLRLPAGKRLKEGGGGGWSAPKRMGKTELTGVSLSLSLAPPPDTATLSRVSPTHRENKTPRWFARRRHTYSPHTGGVRRATDAGRVCVVTRTRRYGGGG
jgi:hypothetical protein